MSQVKTGNQVFTSPGDIAEAFKNHFANRGQSLAHTHKKIQNRAIRVITKSSYDTSSRFLLNSLGWDNLSVRRAKQKANLMYKCINNLAPAYLCNLFAPRTPNYYFRNAKIKLCSQNQELTTYSVALVIVALFYGTIFLRKYVHQIPLVSLTEVPIDGFLISTPTRQICKTVFENF